jgi:hypothetical protein
MYFQIENWIQFRFLKTWRSSETHLAGLGDDIAGARGRLHEDRGELGPGGAAGVALDGDGPES